MQIDQRVRAVLVTPSQELMLIKRVREGQRPYYLAPGCGVLPQDRSYEAALMRGVDEELGGRVSVIKPLFQMEHLIEEEICVKQWFYLCLLLNSVVRTQFDHPERGVYEVETVALDADVLQKLDIQPGKLKQYIITHCEALFAFANAL